MDYLVPMAAETPPIIVGHVETPTAFAEGGFKGAGEAGTRASAQRLVVREEGLPATPPPATGR